MKSVAFGEQGSFYPSLCGATLFDIVFRRVLIQSPANPFAADTWLSYRPTRHAHHPALPT